MPGSCFIDSNIILYAYMKGRDSRRAVALTVLENPQSMISTQVVAEVCCNLIKKSGYSETDISQSIQEFYAQFYVAALDKDTFLAASGIRSKHHLSFWDSTIVASAMLAGCSILYSEDLQAGQAVEGVQIVNPFK